MPRRQAITGNSMAASVPMTLSWNMRSEYDTTLHRYTSRDHIFIPPGDRPERRLEGWPLMDALGKRIIDDTAEIASKLTRAASLEAQARQLRQEAAEIQRLLELARIWQG